MKFEKHAALANRGSDIKENVILVVCLLLCCATIAAYAGLLPAGHWQDEYYTFARFRDEGLSFLIERIRTWSPRPLSEVLVYLYSMVVVKTGRPLITTVLSITWLVTALAVVVLPARYAQRHDRALTATVGLALCALFLANHPTGEMYYWPQAAIAYVPALAAIGALFWICVASGLESGRARRAAAAMLIVAACSIEIGAMLVFAIVGLTIASAFAVPRIRKEWRKAVWLVLPFLVSAGVLALVFHGRVSNGNEVMGDAAIVHHARPALHAAIREFAKAIAVSDWNSRSRLQIALAILGKALVFVAFVGLSTRLSRERAHAGAMCWLTILCAACAATTFLTIAAAFYQFGMLCCERHDTLRQCLIYIAIISAACALGLRPRPAQQARSAALSLALLSIAVAINLLSSVDALRSDYARYDALRDFKIANWNRGTAPTSSMLFEQTMPGRIVGGVTVDQKTYTLGTPENGWWIDGVMQFFHKTKVTFKTR